MRSEPISKAEVVVHPARLRIIHALQGREMTTGQIAQALPDLPLASLYRHLKLMKDHGIVRVSEERQRNGIAESVYALVTGAARFTREEFAAIPPEDHQRFFAIFLGALSSTVTRYFEEPGYDTTRDGMTYFIGHLRLSDEKRRQLRLDLLDLARRYADEQSEDGRPTQLGVSLTPDLQFQEPE